MKKKDSLLDLSENLTSTEIAESVSAAQVLPAGLSGMQAIIKLFDTQIYRTQAVAGARDLAIQRLSSMLADSGQELSPTQTIEAVRVLSDIERESTQSLFNLVRPQSRDGVNIFVNPSDVPATGAPLPITGGSIGSASDNKKVAHYNEFMDAVERYNAEKNGRQ